MTTNFQFVLEVFQVEDGRYYEGRIGFDPGGMVYYDICYATPIGAQRGWRWRRRLKALDRQMSKGSFEEFRKEFSVRITKDERDLELPNHAYVFFCGLITREVESHYYNPITRATNESKTMRSNAEMLGATLKTGTSFAGTMTMQNGEAGELLALLNT